jgi:hypothetical protein
MRGSLVCVIALVLVLSACGSSEVCHCPAGIGSILLPADVRTAVAEVTVADARCSATYDTETGMVFVNVSRPISSGSTVTCTVRVRLDSGALLDSSVAFANATGCCAGTAVKVVDSSVLERVDASTDQ